MPLLSGFVVFIITALLYFYGPEDAKNLFLSLDTSGLAAASSLVACSGILQARPLELLSTFGDFIFHSCSFQLSAGGGVQSYV